MYILCFYNLSKKGIPKYLLPYKNTIKSALNFKKYNSHTIRCKKNIDNSNEHLVFIFYKKKDTYPNKVCIDTFKKKVKNKYIYIIKSTQHPYISSTLELIKTEGYKTFLKKNSVKHKQKHEITYVLKSDVLEMNDIHQSWKPLFHQEIQKPHFKHLETFLSNEFTQYTIYPPKNLIFNLFKQCPLNNIKVIIIGQDCYHGEGQACGLSFSVPKGIKVPSSLQNIYKELNNDPDIYFNIPKHGDLTPWVRQGVFLLNSALSVRKKTAGSHLKYWQEFTDAVIKYISDELDEVVFVCWGNFARKKKNIIDGSKHTILEAVHPSGLSAHRGFFGCRHFSKINNILQREKNMFIDWNL